MQLSSLIKGKNKDIKWEHDIMLVSKMHEDKDKSIDSTNCTSSETKDWKSQVFSKPSVNYILVYCFQAHIICTEDDV